MESVPGRVEQPRESIFADQHRGSLDKPTHILFFHKLIGYLDYGQVLR